MPKRVTLLSVPLITVQSVIGALNIYVPERRSFTEEETRFARAVAGQAALALECKINVRSTPDEAHPRGAKSYRTCERDNPAP